MKRVLFARTEAMSAPMRNQLSRRKGWRMPENTVKVEPDPGVQTKKGSR